MMQRVFWKIKSSGNSCDGCKTLQIYLIPLNYTIKNSYYRKFMLCVFTTIKNIEKKRHRHNPGNTTYRRRNKCPHRQRLELCIYKVRNTWSHQKPEEIRNRFSLRSPSTQREYCLCLVSDYGLPNCERKNFCCLKYKVYDNLLQQLLGASNISHT